MWLGCKLSSRETRFFVLFQFHHSCEKGFGTRVLLRACQISIERLWRHCSMIPVPVFRAINPVVSLGNTWVCSSWRWREQRTPPDQTIYETSFQLEIISSRSAALFPWCFAKCCLSFNMELKVLSSLLVLLRAVQLCAASVIPGQKVIGDSNENFDSILKS